MKLPQRLQRKRIKGWKMPENSLYVGRPTKWGNPFPVDLFPSHYTRVQHMLLSIYMYKEWLKGSYIEWLLYLGYIGIRKELVVGSLKELYGSTIDTILTSIEDRVVVTFNAPCVSNRYYIRNHLQDLLQYDYLACWCQNDQPCHIDVLLNLLEETYVRTYI